MLDGIPAIIQAGGFGKRIRAVDATLPKPLIDIAGKSVLFRQIDALLEAGVGDVYVMAGYMADVMQSHISSRYGDRIKVIVEEQPLGSGGCLALLKGKITRTALLISGDLVFSMDLARLVAFHRRNQAVITLCIHPNTHPRDSDLVELDAEQRVTKMLTRPHPENFKYRNLVNAAISVVEPALWDLIPGPVSLNFEKDLVNGALARGWRVFGYATAEFIADMGTPDRWERITKALETGFVDARHLSRPQRAIFLDRDGVINRHDGYVTKPGEFVLLPHVVDAIKLINRSQYLAIVITNQPQVARGLCSLADIGEIHKEMETQLGDQGAKLDDIFFCPHHPDRGFAGENLEFKIDCDCRKPKIGMLLQARERYNIDFSKSFFIGDSQRDIDAGRKAGCGTELVGEKTAASLLSAVQSILNR